MSEKNFNKVKGILRSVFTIAAIILGCYWFNYKVVLVVYLLILSSNLKGISYKQFKNNNKQWK